MSPRDLGSIFKAYDVRGVVPEELDEDVARRIGAAFAEWSGAPRIAVGRDCRLSSPALAAALIEGIASRGTDVWDLGLVSTDLLYFASGDLDVPGVSVTASHNPPQYNGLKFCLAGPRRWARTPGSATSGRSQNGTGRGRSPIAAGSSGATCWTGSSTTCWASSTGTA